MLNKCVYLRIRQKNRQIYYYCTKMRENVQKCCYIGCLEKEYKKKSIKQKSNKQKSLEENRFSILQNDLNKCYFCNNTATDWHELLKGRNRKKCIKWGLCIRLCRECHRKTEDDSSFYKETKKLAQIKWKEYYCKSNEEFINEFGRNYLV